MKNKIIICLLLLTSIFVGCSEDLYEEPNSFSDFGFYTSIFTGTTPNSAIYKYMSFSDLSQGAISHTWTIEEPNTYLDVPIPTRETNFIPYEKKEQKLVTEDKTIHVLFKKSGIQKVRLQNTFKEYVVYRGAGGYTYPSKKVGNVWVIDTTFSVKVYDSIAPLMQVKYKGAIVSHNKPTDIITIEAGDQLEFTDLTVLGEPTSRSWKIGPYTSTSTVFTATFKTLGEYNTNTFTVTRAEVPKLTPGDSETYKIPATIKVIPSTKPLAPSGTITELESETIQIPYAVNLKPFTNEISHFKVTVNGIDFPISSVALNASDPSIIEVKLVSKIYGSDVVKISCDGATTIKSIDDRSPVAFTDSPVTMNEIFLINLPVGGFEDTFGQIWKGSSTNTGIVAYSKEQVGSGLASMKGVAIDATKSFRFESSASAANLFALKAGKTYIVGYKRYVVSAGLTATGDRIYINNPQKQINTAFSNFTTKDAWQSIQFEYSPTAAATGQFLLVQVSGVATVYYDDFVIKEKDVRP